MKLKALLIVLPFACSNIVSAPSCDDVIKGIIDWQINSQRYTGHWINFIMSTMNSFRRDSPGDPPLPWISYSLGAFGDSSLTTRVPSTFSDRTRDMKNIDYPEAGNLINIGQYDQPFDYRQPTDISITLARPNILYLTYYWGNGESHKFDLNCVGEFMFGVSEQNPALAVTFRTASWYRYSLH